MQSKTCPPCLPSIKFLLEPMTPIDDSHGHSFGYNTPSQQTPITPITTSSGSSYHQLLPSISSSQPNPNVHHLSTINAHNTHNSNISSYDPHPSNIKSLLSPPESPDMTSSHQHHHQQQSHFDTYGIRHDRYSVSQPQQPQPPPPPQQQQCDCCINKPTSTVYSTPTAIMNTQTSINSYNPYIQQQPIQRYSSFPSTLPVPISSSFTRLNNLNLGLPTIKHYSQKNITSNGTSNGNRYQCPYCSKRFSRPSSLRIHIYSHTGEKPFVCTEPGCGRKFSVQSNMRRHLRVHRLGRPVKKTRYDGEVEGVKILSSAAMLRSY